MMRRPPRSTLDRSSAASDVYKRQAALHRYEVNQALRHAWPQRGMAQRLVDLVTMERGTGLPGYTAGNSLNLLRHIGDDLTGADFSQVSIWRAFLQGVDLHEVNLAGADLRETVFTEAFSSVAALGLSPDGALLAAGADSGDIYLWRCRDFKRLLTLKGHNDWVRSVTFSPDGGLLASASSDKTIRLWDVRTGDCVRSLVGHENRVRSVAFSPDGSLLVSASSDETARVWRVADGQLLRTLVGHEDVVYSARFSARGLWLASCSYDKTIRLWDVATGACLRTLTGHDGCVLPLAFHPTNEHLLASGSDDKTVRLWDVRDGACLHIFADHDAEVRSVASVSYTHLRAHETVLDLVCRLLLEKKNSSLIHRDLSHMYYDTIQKQTLRPVAQCRCHYAKSVWNCYHNVTP